MLLRETNQITHWWKAGNFSQSFSTQWENLSPFPDKILSLRCCGLILNVICTPNQRAFNQPHDIPSCRKWHFWWHSYKKQHCEFFFHQNGKRQASSLAQLYLFVKSGCFWTEGKHTFPDGDCFSLYMDDIPQDLQCFPRLLLNTGKVRVSLSKFLIPLKTGKQEPTQKRNIPFCQVSFSIYVQGPPIPLGFTWSLLCPIASTVKRCWESLLARIGNLPALEISWKGNAEF